MRTRVDVLVADDSDEDAYITLYALRRAAPRYVPMRLTDGDQVLQYIFATGGFTGRPAGLPLLVLLDVEMPS